MYARGEFDVWNSERTEIAELFDGVELAVVVAPVVDQRE